MARKKRVYREGGQKVMNSVFPFVLSPTVSPSADKSSGRLPSAMEAV